MALSFRMMTLGKSIYRARRMLSLMREIHPQNDE
jgi:hypothetical protein